LTTIIDITLSIRNTLINVVENFWMLRSLFAKGFTRYFSCNKKPPPLRGEGYFIGGGGGN
jgi:hypothetical protein